MKAPDGKYHVGIRPEGLVPSEGGKLRASLRGVEVMGRDTSVIFECADMGVMRAIVSSGSAMGVSGGEVAFDLKREKVHLFDHDTEERVRY